MNREQIIELARKANIKQAIETPHLLMVHELERFAALVYAAGQRDMREKAALVCKTIRAVQNDGCDDGWEFGIEHGAKHCAIAIRALLVEGENQ